MKNTNSSQSCDRWLVRRRNPRSQRSTCSENMKVAKAGGNRRAKSTTTQPFACAKLVRATTWLGTGSVGNGKNIQKNSFFRPCHGSSTQRASEDRISFFCFDQKKNKPIDISPFFSIMQPTIFADSITAVPFTILASIKLKYKLLLEMTTKRLRLKLQKI